MTLERSRSDLSNRISIKIGQNVEIWFCIKIYITGWTKANCNFKNSSYRHTKWIFLFWKAWLLLPVSKINPKKIQFALVSPVCFRFRKFTYLSRWQTNILNEFSAPRKVSWSNISTAVIQLAEWSLAISSKLPSMDLYCNNMMDRVMSPTKIKSPLVFKYNAIIWLKFEHSNLKKKEI